jgi:hypothetical protein
MLRFLLTRLSLVIPTFFGMTVLAFARSGRTKISLASGFPEPGTAHNRSLVAANA